MVNTRGRTMVDSTFEHFVTELMGLEAESPCYKSLIENGINSARDIATLEEGAIDLLTYEKVDPDDDSITTTTQLPLYQRQLLRIVGDFVRHLRVENNNRLNNDVLLAATKDDWDEFRITSRDVRKSIDANVLKKQTNTKYGRNNVTNNELSNFIKGIKRDKTQYNEFKDERNFENWKRSFLATARSHRIDDVFNSQYLPTSFEDMEVFEEKQKFAFSVLDATLKSDMGKSLVRKYEDTFNAQMIWKEFVEYMKTSTKAQISSADILSWITSAKYDNTWKGTSNGFVLYWMNKVQDYDNFIIDQRDRFSENQKLSMLQNTVNDIPELRQVRTNMELEVAKGGNRLSYQQYINLLLSAAATYDKTNSSARANVKKQHVYISEFDTDNNNYDYSIYNNNIKEEHDEYDIDTYLANVTNRQPPILARKQKVNENQQYSRPFIQRDVWTQLPKEAQDILLSYKNNNEKGKVHYNSVQSNVVLETNSTSVDSNQSHPSTFESSTIPTTMVNKTDRNTSSSDQGSDFLRQILSTNRSVSSTNTQNSNILESKGEGTMVFNGSIYRKVNVTYRVSKHKSDSQGYSLVDRGANGGVFGNDVRIIEKTNKRVSITGLDNHQVNDLPLCTGAAYTMSHKGPIIIIMHQYAYIGQSKTIHASIQMEAYKIQVDEKSKKIPGGKQRLTTPDGYLLPLNLIQGLAYLKIRPPTDYELENLPHVILTSDQDWDPNIFDNNINENSDDWYQIEDIPDNYESHPFTDKGQYTKRHLDTLELVIDNVNVKEKAPDFEKLQPYFGWIPVDVIKKTYEVTTQYARSLHLYQDMRKHFKSRFPSLNVARRNEAVATDTIFSDTAAIDDGSKCAQFFVGRESLVCDIYGMKSEKQFVNTLEDNIRKRGAMSKLISDRAQSEISNKAKDLLRALFIDEWQSEPHHQHQNYAERRYNTIKSKTNIILNRTGAPAYCWLLCLAYVCFILNHVATESLQWKTPMQMLTGETSDISIITNFVFYEKVYYSRVHTSFPSQSTEEIGYFVGFGESVGDAMTFKVLTSDTKKIIYRSNVRSAENDATFNKRLKPVMDQPNVIFIKSKSDDEVQPNSGLKPLPGFNPSELIGRSYLNVPGEDGQTFRMRIVKAISDHQENIDKHPDKIKFLVKCRDQDMEHIVTYNEVIDHIMRNNSEDESIDNQYLKFKSILNHQGPLTKDDPEYIGSKYNVLVDWEDGECTYEPLCVIAADDPVTCALYAKQNNLLEEPGWKRFKRMVNKEVQFQRMINQTRLQSVRRTTRYKYGFKVPNSHAEAMQFDKENGNTLWADAEKLEISQLLGYNTFIDKGKGVPAPSGYKQIRCHMIYDVKHDGRHRARLVAGGHLTSIPLDSIYSGVVSLRGLRLIVFLSELNGLCLWGADVGHAYLEALTAEKVFIIAGPEFGELQGHTLVIYKALYGLRSSGLRWHERLADILRDMGFFPSRAETDIWMRRQGDIYEYIAVYVDDLAIAAVNPKEIISELEKKHKLKLKGVGKMKFHLGCDFFNDPDGTLCFGPRRYIDKMMDTYVQMFNEAPKEFSSPLEKNDHPELDDSEFLNDQDIKIYQSMVGACQWAVSLGRFDIQTALMTMSQFRIAPRNGHLSRMKRLYGYLKRFRDGAIRVRVGVPDFSGIPDPVHDWDYSIYGKVTELIPENLPEPLGKHVVLSHFKDANLYHDLITGRAVTGILHLVNQTPVEWYSKKQGTVETATYGAEFVAARTATDQIIDLRTTLRYLGVPVKGASYMFGDNQSVITSSTIPHSTLKKRHNALSFHRVREAIAANIFQFFKIRSEDNPADILSKHNGYQQAWPHIRALLFWRGETEIKLRKNGE